jgi:cyclopropane fatty-acyl-phospholipid synthase-like methyltransferase
MRILILLILTSVLFARGTIPANRYEQLSGKKHGANEKVYWNKRYDRSSYVFGKAPEKFLSGNYDFIPAGSKVLDIAMGEGRHAVFLAKKGYKVTGIDISSIAVKKAKKLAGEFGTRIETIVASLNDYEFPLESFDAIICFYYLDREFNKKMMKWLKKGGILIFESFTTKQRKVRGFEHQNTKYLLKEGELLNLFPGNRILKYEEPIHLGKFTTSLIIQKK